MSGSATKNVKFDPSKQKIVICKTCQREMVVGKYAKVKQKCDNCSDIYNKSIEKRPVEDIKSTKAKTFSSKLQEICNKLEFAITDKRTWKKTYPISGGGIATVHIMPEQAMTGMEPRIEYFSLVTQRAIGVNEDFRKFMPVEAANDCEFIVAEIGPTQITRPKLGQEKCDGCGAYTDEFGVDTKAGKVLCISPHGCFKKHFTSGNAESEG